MDLDFITSNFFGLIIIFLFGIWILFYIVSVWKVYEKAGQKGWSSLIPIYGTYIFLKIIEKPIWWMILLLVPFVGNVVAILMNIELAKKFGEGEMFGLIVLSFLPLIGFPILGFGKNKYNGSSTLSFATKDSVSNQTVTQPTEIPPSTTKTP